MNETVSLNNYFDLLKEKWWNTDASVSLNKTPISYLEKKKRERRFDKSIDNIIIHINNFPNSDNEICIWNKKLNEIINTFLLNGYIFNIDFLPKFKDDFFKITKEFIKEARSFDKELKIEDIGQAMRNVWIINILQVIKGEEVKLTRAVYGYSMLYPYTDNYLDDISININDKKEFNNRFSRRLKGEKINYANEYENKIYKLLENIEKTFSREEYPYVYESLLKIQEGQILSLNQQDKITIPYERDILGVSIEKGGASVLVDGYLINGELNDEEINFCIGYGALLQLADDLQDVEEDLKNKHMTIISQLAGKYNLDPIADKLINFTINIVDEFKFEKCEDDIELKNLIKDNCVMLILFSMVLSKRFFSKENIKEKSKSLPFTIKYIENLKSNLYNKFRSIKKSNDEIMNIMDKIVNIN